LRDTSEKPPIAAPADVLEEAVRRKLTYCFDIDGTICDTPATDYAAAVAIVEAVAEVNRLYDSGNRILLFTARGTVTGIDWRPLTESQLRSWGVKYHDLLLGKPSADVYVDDRAVSAAAWRKSGYQMDATLKASGD
jgi:hypothetical protein